MLSLGLLIVKLRVDNYDSFHTENDVNGQKTLQVVALFKKLLKRVICTLKLLTDKSQPKLRGVWGGGLD